MRGRVKRVGYLLLLFASSSVALFPGKEKEPHPNRSVVLQPLPSTAVGTPINLPNAQRRMVAKSYETKVDAISVRPMAFALL